MKTNSCHFHLSTVLPIPIQKSNLLKSNHLYNTISFISVVSNDINQLRVGGGAETKGRHPVIKQGVEFGFHKHQFFYHLWIFCPHGIPFQSGSQTGRGQEVNHISRNGRVVLSKLARKKEKTTRFKVFEKGGGVYRFNLRYILQ